MRNWAFILIIASRALADAEPTGPRVEVSVRLDKPQFEVGEAIPATLEIINRGETDYSVLTSTEPTGLMDGIEFRVTDGDGNLLPRPHIVTKPDTWIGSWLVLRRHEKCERKLFLNHWFLPLSPGRFNVEALYTPRGSVGDRPADWPLVRSPRVQFEIAPTTTTKLEVRISRLTEQAEKGDQVAIDFLGFTGESAAIAPLTEALYSDDFHVQRRAAVALCLINDQATTMIAVLAKARELGPTPMMAEWFAVQNAPPAVVLPIYLEAVKSQDTAARLGGITGLRLTLDAALADKKFASATRWAIRHGLTDRDARVRYEAILATQLHAEPQSIGILKDIAKSDPTIRVRSAAAAALQEIRAGRNQ